MGAAAAAAADGLEAAFTADITARVLAGRRIRDVRPPDRAPIDAHDPTGAATTVVAIVHFRRL